MRETIFFSSCPFLHVSVYFTRRWHAILTIPWCLGIICLTLQFLSSFSSSLLDNAHILDTHKQQFNWLTLTFIICVGTMQSGKASVQVLPPTTTSQGPTSHQWKESPGPQTSLDADGCCTDWIPSTPDTSPPNCCCCCSRSISWTTAHRGA